MNFEAGGPKAEYERVLQKNTSVRNSSSPLRLTATDEEWLQRAMAQDDLNQRIKDLEVSRSAVEERRRFAHTRRKLALDGLEADQAREEERAARVELERIQREISALQARSRSAVTKG